MLGWHTSGGFWRCERRHQRAPRYDRHMRALVAVVVTLLSATAALAAPLPGVRTPTGNIRCFYVPIKPTSHGTLLCDLKRADYARVAQEKCMARSGLDWHGFALPWNGRGDLSCSGGDWRLPAFVDTWWLGDQAAFWSSCL